MDRGQEQFLQLGFCGIFKKACKIIISWWKRMFFRITLSLILPFCLVVLADMHIFDYLIGKIIGHHFDLDETWSYDPRYDQLKRKLVREWSLFGSLNVLYFLVGLLFLFPLTISAVIYTTACIFTAKEITFKKVMSVVPKIWKRLVTTYLWNFFITLVYNGVTAALLVLSFVLIRNKSIRVLGIVLAAVVVILYFVCLVYINMIWQLASVVSVLEDTYGLRALKKGNALIKGKIRLNIAIAVTFMVLVFGLQVGYFFSVVVNGSILAVVLHIGAGIVCLLVLLILTLLGCVVQTILYFVCKSYHHESIDSSCLAEHLEEGYLLGKTVHLGEKVGNV